MCATIFKQDGRANLCSILADIGRRRTSSNPANTERRINSQPFTMSMLSQSRRQKEMKKTIADGFDGRRAVEYSLGKSLVGMDQMHLQKTAPHCVLLPALHLPLHCPLFVPPILHSLSPSSSLSRRGGTRDWDFHRA